MERPRERHMASAGLTVGEGHDADANLAHVSSGAPCATWTPQRVLETGVARGVTSALALGAMAQSNGGRSPLEHRSAPNDVRLA